MATGRKRLVYLIGFGSCFLSNTRDFSSIFKPGYGIQSGARPYLAAWLVEAQSVIIVIRLPLVSLNARSAEYNAL